MDFNSNLPIYIQIMDYLKKQIISRELKEGDKLDSVRELSTKLKVNPNTIQRSYQELEREGLVYTQRGMGTFVTEDVEVISKFKREMASDVVGSFIIEMKQLGFNRDDIVELVNTKVGEV
ncbi:MAG: GntR family transcriptional regulator [Tissierellaceae bacterium]|nr:GntR family transcriptional regulator [Tissierellaceae bacterium]